MNTRNFAFILALLCVLAILGGCKQGNTAKPSSTMPITTASNANAESSRPGVLVKDLVRTGLVPGAPLPTGFKAKLAQPAPKGSEGKDMYQAQNAAIFLNRVNKTLSTAVIKGNNSAGPTGLSKVDFNTQDGRNVLNLTQEEVIKEYGQPSAKLPTTGGGNPGTGLYYSYKVNPKTVVSVIFNFSQDGDKPGKLDSIKVDTLTNPDDIAAFDKQAKYYDWPGKL
jgi:hypothetical protein